MMLARGRHRGEVVDHEQLNTRQPAVATRTAPTPIGASAGTLSRYVTSPAFPGTPVTSAPSLSRRRPARPPAT